MNKPWKVSIDFCQPHDIDWHVTVNCGRFLSLGLSPDHNSCISTIRRLGTQIEVFEMSVNRLVTIRAAAVWGNAR